MTLIHLLKVYFSQALTSSMTRKVEMETDLSAGGPHGSPGDFNVEAPLWVLLSSQGGVVVRLPARLPVTHRFPDGLKDAAANGSETLISLSIREKKN